MGNVKKCRHSYILTIPYIECLKSQFSYRHHSWLYSKSKLKLHCTWKKSNSNFLSVLISFFFVIKAKLQVLKFCQVNLGWNNG